MENIEKMYRFAVQRNCDFNFRRSHDGTISCFIISPQSETILDYHKGSFESISVAQKRYDRFDEALRDYNDLLILKGE